MVFFLSRALLSLPFHLFGVYNFSKCFAFFITMLYKPLCSDMCKLIILLFIEERKRLKKTVELSGNEFQSTISGAKEISLYLGHLNSELRSVPMD